jgi:MFS family permease
MANEHDPFLALRHPEYRQFLLGAFVASIGSQMQGVAIGWQVYDITHSPLSLGFIGMVQAIPALSLALFGGHLADRRDRRNILFITQTVYFLGSLALFAATRRMPGAVWPIYAILFAEGIARGFQGPAMSSLTPLLVPPPVFPSAVTWRTASFQLSALAGPILGGFLIDWNRDPSHVYAVNAALGAIAFATLFFIQPRPAPPAPEKESLKESLMQGVHFVRTHPALLGPITLDLFAVLFGGAVALLPVFAKDILHVGPDGLGLMRAAPSVGAMLMAIYLIRRPPIQKSGKALLLNVALFGVAMIGFGLSKNFIVSLLFLALSGAVDNVSMVIRSTVEQSLTPNPMRGRVSAVHGIFVGASNELGAFESGVAAQWLGTVPSVAAGGFMTLVVVGTTAWIWPEMRNLGPLDQLRPDEEEPSVPEEETPLPVE